MVQSEADPLQSPRRKAPQSHRRRDTRAPRIRKGLVDGDLPAEERPTDLEALRKARLEYLDTPAEERTRSMRSVGEPIRRMPAKKVDAENAHTSSVSGRRRRTTAQGSQPRRIEVRPVDSKSSQYQSVYEQGTRKRDTQPRRAKATREERLRSEESESQSEASSNGTPAKEANQPRPQRQSSRGVTKGQQHKPPRRRQSEPMVRTQQPRRTLSGTEEGPTTLTDRNTANMRRHQVSRPSLFRSATTTRSRSDTVPAARAGDMQKTMSPSVAESQGKRGLSIFSSLLRSSTVTPAGLKKVNCLTCGSDNVPVMKTAKLACTHRMCHDCLRRIFTMSVTDPAHMPPKCCTADHIPLKHVDSLFDQKFKKTWNRKFQEYSTRNRIYCPARHCGEWIKPHHISVENGRKIAKCKKCGTRACCICNHKMHTSRECPRDPATKIFIEVAKQAGWKRCFNCSAMVELKEGCNHMTCRCKAEFCMACGCKWKTCDCPWFNYEAVRADRLEHMMAAHAEGVPNAEDRRAPIRYQEQVDQRRRQERRDEMLARRLQMLGLDRDPAGGNRDENEDLGQGLGVGNAANHFLNDHFQHQARNVVTGNFRQAVQAADGLIMGAMTGRENPLPPAPFELENVARTAATQTAQLLRPETSSNNSPRRANTGRRRPAAQGGESNSGNNIVVSNANMNDGSGQAATDPVPWQEMALPQRSPSVRQPRPIDILLGRSPPANVGPHQPAVGTNAGQQRIETWRNEVPVGLEADDRARIPT